MAGQLLASQGLCSMELLVSWLVYYNPIFTWRHEATSGSQSNGV